MSSPSPERQVAETKIRGTLTRANRIRRWAAGISLLASLAAGYAHWNEAGWERPAGIGAVLATVGGLVSSVRTQRRAQNDCTAFVNEYATMRGFTEHSLYKPDTYGRRGEPDRKAHLWLEHDYMFRRAGHPAVALIGLGGFLVAEGSRYPEHLKNNPDLLDFTVTYAGLGEMALAAGGLLHLAGSHANAALLEACRARLNNIDGYAA